MKLVFRDGRETLLIFDCLYLDTVPCADDLHLPTCNNQHRSLLLHRSPYALQSTTTTSVEPRMDDHNCLDLFSHHLHSNVLFLKSTAQNYIYEQHSILLYLYSKPQHRRFCISHHCVSRRIYATAGHNDSIVLSNSALSLEPTEKTICFGKR